MVEGEITPEGAAVVAEAVTEAAVANEQAAEAVHAAQEAETAAVVAVAAATEVEALAEARADQAIAEAVIEAGEVVSDTRTDIEILRGDVSSLHNQMDELKTALAEQGLTMAALLAASQPSTPSIPATPEPPAPEGTAHLEAEPNPDEGQGVHEKTDSHQEAEQASHRRHRPRL